MIDGEFKSCVESIKGAIPQTAILIQLAEELAETAQAALKLVRIGEGINPTPITFEQAYLNLYEELGDVAACLACLNGLNYSVIQKIEVKKLKRWSERLAQFRQV